MMIRVLLLASLSVVLFQLCDGKATGESQIETSQKQLLQELKRQGPKRLESNENNQAYKNNVGEPIYFSNIEEKLRAQINFPKSAKKLLRDETAALAAFLTNEIGDGKRDIEDKSGKSGEKKEGNAFMRGINWLLTPVYAICGWIKRNIFRMK